MSKNYVTVLEAESPAWRYGSDLTVYTERFLDGRLIGASYRDNGIPVYEHMENTDLPSFDLVIDGQSMYYGWEMVGFATAGEDGIASGTLTLKHSLKPVTMTITTRAAGYGFIRRSMTITNTSSDETLGLTSVTPLQGYLWNDRPVLLQNLEDNTVVPYSVGYMRGNKWGNEGNFVWQDIPFSTEISYGSTLGRSGHGSPFFVLRENVYGGYAVCQLGWSGNWKMAFFNDYDELKGTIRLRFAVMPIAIPPARMISPGEIISVPDVHFGLSHDDFDTAIQNLHAYQRESILPKVGDGLQPVIYNHWGYCQHEMSEEALKSEIDIASELGAELFIVDAGWFGSKGADWFETTGDWTVGDRLPKGLEPIFDYAREKGLKYGLWYEIESASSSSKLAQEHPDWFITRYGKPVERVLDLTKPEVQKYIESTIVEGIERYNLDLFRLDYNLSAYEGGFNLLDGRSENTIWRHVEVIYEIFDRVRQKFPNLMLENCSSGGGRTDVGIMSRFDTTWTSDWMLLPRTVRILNGLTMTLPPEYCNRTVGMGCTTDKGSFDTLMHVVILGHPCISGLTPNLAGANPELMARAKKYIDIYKNFIRTFHREAKVYHHTPVIPGADGTGWAALEYVSQDRKKCVATVFRLIKAGGDSYRLRFRGLDPSLDYLLTTEPSGLTCQRDGYSLMNDGLEVRLDLGLTSKLLLLTAK